MKTKTPVRPHFGPLPLPPKRKRAPRKQVPPHISRLECSICGESLAGEDGKGMVYQTCFDRVCQYCFGSGSDLLKALDIEPGSVKGSSVFDALFRLLSRTGHKARVRVRQHEERKHDRSPLSFGEWESHRP